MRNNIGVIIISIKIVQYSIQTAVETINKMIFSESSREEAILFMSEGEDTNTSELWQDDRKNE